MWLVWNRQKNRKRKTPSKRKPTRNQIDSPIGKGNESVVEDPSSDTDEVEEEKNEVSGKATTKSRRRRRRRRRR